MKKLCDLPNQKGFEFIGIRHDRKYGNCIVQRDESSGCHFVAGDIQFADLKGWIEIGTARKCGIRANVQPTNKGQNTGSPVGK